MFMTFNSFTLLSNKFKETLYKKMASIQCIMCNATFSTIQQNKNLIFQKYSFTERTNIVYKEANIIIKMCC